MEALRKQASKFKEQVAKQQQVRIPHPNTLMLPCASRFFLLPVREENGRDLASFSLGNVLRGCRQDMEARFCCRI